MIKNKIELAIHLAFWVFIFSAVNVEWTANWFDVQSRPNTPAPLSVIIFPFYFYANAFLLIPKYFSLETWKQYLIYSFLVFILPECVRIVLYIATFSANSVEAELFSRDSFLFGAPSPFFLAINASFIYRFAKDWLTKKRKEGNVVENETDAPSKPYVNATVITTEESAQLKANLAVQLEQEELFLNPSITLRELAEALNTSEKKLSYFINQELSSSFYELLNKHRVAKFKAEVEKEENKNLSIVGIALNCGFPSKSSFYRAFKAQVGVSPSAYIKSIHQER